MESVIAVCARTRPARAWTRTIVAAAVIAITAVSAGHDVHARQPSSLPPNVILILTDDMGWADLGSYGATDVRTPHIDRLAREGVRFTEFYSSGVLCSPTRAGIISGRYQQRYGIEVALPNAARAGNLGLPAGADSLPRVLKARGYRTSLLGKWHLGHLPQFSPLQHGFDAFFGLKAGFHDYYAHTDGSGSPDLWENDTAISVEGYTTDLITQRAVGFIEAGGDAPFFLEVAYNAPHWPYQRPDQPTVAPDHGRHVAAHEPGASTRADYVSMVERVDRGVGEILGVLDRRDLASRTLVIFTNDNGGEWLADNGPLFNRKWTVWEGGIRVPAIMRWPGQVPAGVTTPQVGSSLDLPASIVAAAGAAVPERYEGIDLLPILRGQQPQQARTLFWRTAVGGLTQKAVRSGDWKLVLDGPHTFVFDVHADPGERHDLTRQRQDVARRLRPMLDAWEADVDAEWKQARPSPPAGTSPPK